MEKPRPPYDVLLLRQASYQLVHDARRFMQSLSCSFLDLTHHNPSSPSEEDAQQIAALSTKAHGQRHFTKEKSTKDIPQISQSEGKKTHAPVKKTSSQTYQNDSDWQLQPALLPMTNSHYFHKKLSTLMPTHDLRIDLLLLLPEENRLHRLFLQGVCRALAGLQCPATIALYTQDVINNFPCKYILMPLSLCKKQFFRSVVHQPMIAASQNKVILPLENLDLYLHHRQHKRDLWKAIQHLLQS